MSTKFCFLVLALAIAVVFAQEKENPFKQLVLDCYSTTKPDQAKFEVCLLDVWKKSIGKVTRGIPELGVPPLDPLDIGNIVFNEKSTIVDVAATFSNVTARGVTQAVPKTLSIDRKTSTIRVTFLFPFLHATGSYDIQGTVLLTPVTGKGPFTLNMTNVDAVATAHFFKDGAVMRVNKLDVDFTIGDFGLHAGGLSQDTVGDAVLKMLTDNQQEILADIKPRIIQQITDISLKVLTGGAFSLPAGALGF